MAGRRLMWVAGQGKKGCRSRQPQGVLQHHSEKAQGSHVYKCVCVFGCGCVRERYKWRTKCRRRSMRECRGAAVGIQPQNMVVSYLVLTGRLLESRWSKSQVVLPRDCMSVSISRGSIAVLRMLLHD